jgi:hypothetical protein
MIIGPRRRRSNRSNAAKMIIGPNLTCGNVPGSNRSNQVQVRGPKVQCPYRRDGHWTTGPPLDSAS